MKWLKTIILAGIIAIAVIQFIQPAHNTSDMLLPTDIIKSIIIPDKVLDLLKNSCYDCHSDSTRYPWYVNFQPMGWVMAKHIKEGKENLNFSNFGSYSKRKQVNKLRAISSSIEDGSMPISSYTIMHSNAKLSKENIELISKWVVSTGDSMSKKD